MVDPSCPDVLKYNDRAKLSYITVHCRDCGMSAGPFYESNRAMTAMGVHRHKGVYAARHNESAPLPEQKDLWETEHVKFCRRCFEFGKSHQRGESVDTTPIDMLIERFMSGMSVAECVNRTLYGSRSRDPLRECIDMLVHHKVIDHKSLLEGTLADQLSHLENLRSSLVASLSTIHSLDHRQRTIELVDSLDSALPILRRM